MNELEDIYRYMQRDPEEQANGLQGERQYNSIVRNP